jgi:outer membrane protein assembly factor BamB
MRPIMWVLLAGLLAGCAPADPPPAPAPKPAGEKPQSPTAPGPAGTAGVDWPCFLGPTHDNVSTEKGILTTWPKDGLRKVWECEMGLGFAPPVVAAGKLFHFDRFDNNCQLTCREALTGKFLWKFDSPTDYEDRYGYSPGPRACPVVDGDRVYILGPEGMLVCLKVEDGKEVWRCDTRAKFHFQQNFFGVGSVPLVDGELLIVPVGGSPRGPRPYDFRLVKPDGTAIVAFDKKTGDVKYARGDELSSYASPVIATINGKRTGLYFARAGLLGFDPQTGDTRFHFKWRARDEESVNAANPVVVGDRVFLSECYAVGSALVEVKNGQPQAVWTDLDKDRSDKSLMCHWNTPIHHAGFVYGCSGRHTEDAELRCVELASGDVKWTKRTRTRSTLMMIDGHFVCLAESGQLSLFKVDPQKYDEVSKYEVPELEYPCWAPPLLSHGLLYVRGKSKLVCLELIPAKSGK